MRWDCPKHGDTRTRSGFLLLPMQIGGRWRWLELARWTESYDEDEWVPISWASEERP